MQVEHHMDEQSGIITVILKGKLDVFSFGELKGYFDELFEKNSNAKVICDIREVSYIASSGWSVLLARRKMARRDGGDLVLCGMNDGIRRVYDSMKIRNLLPAADDIDGARQLLDKSEG